jgi:hypothetical protein
MSARRRFRRTAVSQAASAAAFSAGQIYIQWWQGIRFALLCPKVFHSRDGRASAAVTSCPNRSLLRAAGFRRKGVKQAGIVGVGCSLPLPHGGVVTKWRGAREGQALWPLWSAYWWKCQKCCLCVVYVSGRRGGSHH